MAYLLLQSEFLIDLFLADNDPMTAAVAGFAIPMMIITALFQWGDGTQAITISALRGLNDTKVPAYIAIACFWFVGVGIGAIGAYAFDFDPVAIWGCLMIGLMVASVALTYRLYMATRRITRGGAILTQ
jgi:MATE family multidrug resistance protein